MWLTFNRIGHGRVLEIDCPAKRGKMGRRFSFVRFLDVRNEGELERRLNEFEAGNWRQQSINGNDRRPSYAQVVKTDNSRMDERPNNERRKEGRVQRFGSNNASIYGNQQREWKPKHQQHQWSGMELNFDLEEYAWLEKCFVGTVHLVNLIPNLQEKFFMEGVFFCNIRSMGGRLVLLEGKDHEDLKELVDSGKDWLGNWFEDVKPWTPTLVAMERFTWIQCQGLPVHAWKSKTFQSFGRLWGTFITLDDSTINKKRFDVARFLITTPSTASISKSITVKINGEFFTLKREDICDTEIERVGMPRQRENGRKETQKRRPDLKQWGLTRSLSDNCPILVKDEACNWGPKPFKFYNVWLLDPAFREMIEKQWDSFNIQGWGGFVLEEKMKLLKNSMKVWTRNHVQVVDKQIEEAKETIAKLDCKREVQQLSEEEGILKRDLMLTLWENIQTKEEMARQKSRMTWMKEGDANTSFFHLCIKNRWRRNEINSLVVNEKVSQEVNELKQGVANYFKNLFAKDDWKRPVLEGMEFNKIFEAEKEFLTEPFLESEVKAVVWNCDNAKAPGLDGLSFGFLKTEWEVVKNDILKFLADFHINSCMYKILAKILANRLSKVLNGLIGEQQSAFIGGRQLVDGVVIANETIDEIRKKKLSCFLFKADFEKAYDNVSWEFLDYMLDRMNFGLVWRGWIRECLQTNSISVFLNGSPTKEFTMRRGLRQGDPLAPFLFLIVAEGLNGIISSAVEKALFEGVQIGRGDLRISHLQFVDDTLLMGKAIEENIWTTKCIMRAFELVSGLKINYGKSSLIGINVDDLWEKEMTCLLNCKSGSLPCKYLGIPLGVDLRRIATLKPLIDTFKRKLSSWRRRFLSLGGRITLINAVLTSLLVFIMSFYLLPKSVTGENHNVKDMGNWINGSWQWNLLWKRQLRTWEEDLETDLLEMLRTTHPIQDKEDQWWWQSDPSGNYTSNYFTRNSLQEII
ncbi:hypothetical protein SLEP1_g39340 [Rubroshorea leprosula]|uniref:Reverse transcriptase domain-containing protein n=1 Tax=Rubroshorea leprosula TaxID=152421 RepID=A0AAV5KZW7_9ROSI|nr:hypothetical protein SLEP1_g39340 [Rubroshorea leprosula]